MNNNKSRYKNFYDIDEALVENAFIIPEYRSTLARESLQTLSRKRSRSSEIHFDSTQNFPLFVPAFQDIAFYDYINNMFIGHKAENPYMAVQTSKGKIYQKNSIVTLKNEQFNGAMAIIVGHNKFAIIQLGEFFATDHTMNYSKANNCITGIDKSKRYGYCRKIEKIILVGAYSNLDNRRKHIFADYLDKATVKGKLLSRDNLIVDSLPHELLSLMSNLFILDNCIYINLHFSNLQYELSHVIKLLSSLDLILAFNSDGKFKFRSNLNSPGDIILFCSNATEFLKSNWYIFVLLAVTLFGGEINTSTVKIQFPSVVNFIKWIAAYKVRKKSEDLEFKLKEEDLRSKTIDNKIKEEDLRSKIFDNDFKEGQLERLQPEIEHSKQVDEQELFDAVMEVMEISAAMKLISAPDYTLDKEALLELLSVEVEE